MQCRPVIFPFTLSVLFLLLGTGSANAAKFNLPTGNQAIYSLKGQSQYFVGTVGRSWESGTFGCVRSGGSQMHEGIDIRCVQRDRNGESSDPIRATADGKVAYINPRASLSNYGNYIVLQHVVDGLEIYSLYAHLSEIRSGLKIGQAVKAGETIGKMGRTTNTRERISQERAHLHFELNFFITDRFAHWHKYSFRGARNDHGLWNGQNMIGIDPQEILLVNQRKGAGFNLLEWVQNQRELCRVAVRKTSFPWLKRYARLIKRNPVAEREGIAGYELSLNANGLPFQIVPRAASELKSKAKYHLLSVNPQEHARHPCRSLVARRGNSWQLAANGLRLLDVITY